MIKRFNIDKENSKVKQLWYRDNYAPEYEKNQKSNSSKSNGILDTFLKKVYKDYDYFKNTVSHENPMEIYWDVDDVILNSRETAVKLINKYYREPYGLELKTVNDISDWNFQSIHEGITTEQIEEIFDSREFWNEVNIQYGFLKIMLSEDIQKNYKHNIVTCGTEKNHRIKTEYLKGYNNNAFEDIFNQMNYYAVPQNAPKCLVDMSNGIQVDDNLVNLLNTNAKIKILVKNNQDTEFNDYIDMGLNLDNLYVVNNMEEVYDILVFMMDYMIL